jgi:glyoxylase-like metal-dependent hydrolase (beta-lactamase superfamily II)
MQNFIYLLGDPQTREAAVVDPGWEVDKILAAAAADGYQLTRVILTHTHFDHVLGLVPLLKAMDLPVHVHHTEAHALDVAPSSIRMTDHGDDVSIGSLRAQLIHTPGHTPGSQCLLVDGRLVTGDTLFVNACGRWDLPGGDARELYNSLAQRLKPLEDDTIVYPGHNYAETPTSTIGHEKRRNPFMRPASVNDFLRLVGAPA